MRKPLLVIFLLVAGIASGQRAIVINSLPANTPAEDEISLAGSANDWTPGHADWIFADEAGLLVLSVPEAASNAFQGKITRGSWDTVEGNAAGGFLPNRNFNFNTSDTLYIDVQSWEGNAPPPTDLPPNVVILDQAFFMPELDRSRRIRLFLPTGYDDPGNETNYPVLYMHDGQNLFSAAEAFAGEWEVDEAMLAFEADGYSGAIIVAIDNGGSHRINEYTPYANAQYGGGEGAEYSAFIVNTLKPFVDEEYRTMPEREHNGIMGSSLGGLISFYAAMAYQDVFSKVGVFSPSFWFSDEIYTFAESAGKQAPIQFFFLAGGQESAGLQGDVEQMMELLADAGFGEDELRFDFVPNGQHSEWFWADHFPTAFEWLYMGETLSVEQPFDGFASLSGKNVLRVYPNPASDTFDIQLPKGWQLGTITLRDTQGRVVKTFGESLEYRDISGLSPGVYMVHIQHGDNVHVQKLLKL